MANENCTVVRLGDDSLTPRLSAQVDAIFFEASGRTFAPGPERDAFHERWLGRYLQGGTDVVLLAMDARRNRCRLSRGCAGRSRPSSRASTISPISGASFATCAGAYPAHLHINIAPAFRSRGLGAS